MHYTVPENFSNSYSADNRTVMNNVKVQSFQTRYEYYRVSMESTKTVKCHIPAPINLIENQIRIGPS